jgi:hypothetical protein
MDAPINTRNERTKYSWRNGCRVDSDDGEEDEEEEEGMDAFAGHAIWKKNKHRVIAQRSHALAMLAM